MSFVIFFSARDFHRNHDYHPKSHAEADRSRGALFQM